MVTLEELFSQWTTEYISGLGESLVNTIDNGFDLSYERVVGLFEKIKGGIDCPVELKQLPRILDPGEELSAEAIFRRIKDLEGKGILVKICDETYLVNPKNPTLKDSEK